MWLFLSKGMLSVVQHREQPDSVMIRAREAEVLEWYFGRRGEVTPQADYRFRLTQTKKEFTAFLAKYVDELQYDNFKNSIPAENESYHQACIRIWSVMHKYQEEGSSGHPR